jgi:ubiquinone/menaquinone biosynthesis C-methylase UbiE
MDSDKVPKQIQALTVEAYAENVDGYFVYADDGINGIFSFDKRRDWSLNDGETWSIIKRVLTDESSRINGRLRVLDVGCGSGAWLCRIANESPGAIGVGIDIVKGFVEHTQNLLAMYGFSDRFTAAIGDATNLDFDDSSFDVVITLHDVLNHIPEVKKAIAEMTRVAKGVVLASVHSVHSIPTCYIGGLEDVTDYQQVGDLLTFKKKGKRYEMYSHLISRDELIALFAPYAVVEDVWNIDVFHSRFSQTASDNVPEELEHLENLMLQHPSFSNFAQHIMVKARPVKP